ncbi:MAG: ribonuclease P protein component [Actinobacteria bacterium]|nr:ribonuclease P protein component [Actinomycetota bacterium]MSX98354.1 ribonuclease P protein component [Actinomycetota bacterium]MSY47459.1 ribonuclease P protein component [Actinomycetota bacterium]MTA65327.1 ribonuclease P protein component [Actinomycetota bacterium]MTH90058.1 ribonuclease P protein component [Actinomycetota bacterium]
MSTGKGPLPALCLISRIKTRQTFQQLQQDGTYVRSGSLWCSMLIDQTLTQPAVAYAIGHQVGGAVERNLLRRRLREILKTKSIVPGSYLIGAYSGAKKLKFEDLGHNVDNLLAKCAQKVAITNKIS